MADQFLGPTKMVLSPAAQAIWDAFNDVAERVGTFDDYGDALAAALRAAADQVVPEETWLGTEETCYAYYRQRCKTRRDFLAIAAKLENHQ